MAFKILYSDVGFSANKRPKAINLEAVVNSVKNIISTIPGERVNNPLFGWNSEDWLFEPIDDTTAFGILSSLIFAINKFDDRPIIDMANSIVNPLPDENKYEISLIFSVKGFESEPVVLNFSLER